MLIQTLSTPFARALAQNSYADAYAQNEGYPGLPLGPLAHAPAADASGTAVDGVFAAGQGGEIAANRLCLLPVCEGPAGSAFTLRLFGWTLLGQPDGRAEQVVWVPCLLVELYAVACQQAGPVNPGPGPSQRLVKDTERFCDTIMVLSGSLGAGGYLNSTGPGSNLIAQVFVDLCGCRYFQFDFQQADEVGMQCLWRPC